MKMKSSGMPTRRAQRARLTPALLAVLAVIALAAAQPGSFRTVKGKQCTVKTDATAAIGQAVAKRTDRYCKVFDDWYKPFKLKRRHDNRIVLRLFNTHEDFAQYHQRTTGGERATPAAYFSSSMNAIVLYNDEGDVYLRQTLFHETSHNFLNRYTYDAPRWFNEGLAEYFEGWRMKPSGEFVEVRPNIYDLLLVRRALAQDKFLPPRELVAFDSEAFLEFRERNPKLHGYLHYSTAWSLLYYCFEGPDESYSEVMTQYIKDLNKLGERAQFGIADWEAFEAGWRAFIQGLEPEIVTAEDHILVGAGHRENGDWKAALAEYQAALEADDAAHGARYWVGYCYKRSGKYAEAEQHLLQALDSNPDDPRPAYQLSRIVLGVDLRGSASDPARAQTYIDMALDRSGGKSPVYLLQLARCQEAAGKPDKVTKTLRKILKLVDEEERAPYELWLDHFRERTKAAKKR